MIMISDTQQLGFLIKREEALLSEMITANANKSNWLRSEDSNIITKGKYPCSKRDIREHQNELQELKSNYEKGRH